MSVFAPHPPAPSPPPPPCALEIGFRGFPDYRTHFRAELENFVGLWSSYLQGFANMVYGVDMSLYPESVASPSPIRATLR